MCDSGGVSDRVVELCGGHCGSGTPLDKSEDAKRLLTLEICRTMGKFSISSKHRVENPSYIQNSVKNRHFASRDVAWNASPSGLPRTLTQAVRKVLDETRWNLKPALTFHRVPLVCCATFVLLCFRESMARSIRPLDLSRFRGFSPPAIKHSHGLAVIGGTYPLPRPA